MGLLPAILTPCGSLAAGFGGIWGGLKLVEIIENNWYVKAKKAPSTILQITGSLLQAAGNVSLVTSAGLIGTLFLATAFVPMRGEYARQTLNTASVLLVPAVAGALMSIFGCTIRKIFADEEKMVPLQKAVVIQSNS
jgi:hypothetical protein